MKFEFLEEVNCVRLVNKETGEVKIVPEDEYEERFYVCSECGAVFDTVGAGIEIEGDFVCDDCLDKSGNYVQCEECSEWLPIEKAIETENGYVCQDCCDECYMYCEDCGKVIHQDDACVVDNGWRTDNSYYCEDCVDRHAFWCEGHEQYENRNEFYPYEVNGDLYCSDYCGDNFHWCEGCEEYFADDYEGSYDNNDYWYCNDCRDDGCGNFGNWGDVILDYHGHDRSDKTYFLDKEDRKTTVHMGYELEVDNGSGPEDDDALAVIDIMGSDYFVFEEDGSVAGMEMISQPGSLNAHLSRYEKIEEMCKMLVGLGYTSHTANTCGLHVHIDREFFGDKRNDAVQDLVNAKFLWIFAKHWDNLVRFSRRNRFGYCTKTRKKSYSDPKEVSFAKLAKDYVWNTSWGRQYKCYNYGVGHGNCVNIGGTDTIEIRLWRGSLRPETIKATLKFTARLAELVKTKTVIELDKMSFEDILGDDEDILAYWETRKDRPLPAEALTA